MKSAADGTRTGKRVIPKQTTTPDARPALVRGEVVVRRVLEAAIRELAQVGYHGFRMEDVAVRAKVNKTTVYRRWPTKKDLVRDAFSVAMTGDEDLPNTGNLRADLIAGARAFADRVATPRGRSIVRMLAAERTESGLKEIVRSLHCRNESGITRAISRGELGATTDAVILANVIVGAIVQQAVFMNERITDAYLESLIDLVLLGALTRSAKASDRVRQTAPRTRSAR